MMKVLLSVFLFTSSVAFGGQNVVFFFNPGKSISEIKKTKEFKTCKWDHQEDGLIQVYTCKIKPEFSEFDLLFYSGKLMAISAYFDDKPGHTLTPLQGQDRLDALRGHFGVPDLVKVDKNATDKDWMCWSGEAGESRTCMVDVWKKAGYNVIFHYGLLLGNLIYPSSVMVTDEALYNAYSKAYDARTKVVERKSADTFFK